MNLRKLLQAQAKTEGVSEGEIVRITQRVMHTPLQSLEDVLQVCYNLILMKLLELLSI